jgi:hypothetical protein
MKAKYINEDFYQEPDYKQIFYDGQEHSIEQISQFLEEWTDDNIGLDAANCNVIERPSYLEIWVTAKRTVQNIPAGISMKDEWKGSGEDLLNELTRDNGFTRFWDFELANWSERSCWIRADKKEYKY